MNVKVKKVRNNDPWLVFLCLVLGIATAGFGYLAVRNSKPFTCESTRVDSNNNIICEKVVK